MSNRGTEGWGAVLRGDARDLEDWRTVLGNSFEPWVEVHGEDTVLRSTSFDELSSADEVRALANDKIDYLNGALALSRGTAPIAFGGTVQFTSDGQLHRTIFADGAGTIRVRAQAIGIAIGKDGEPVPPIPQPSEVQLWSAIAEGDDLLHEALMYFGKQPTWFNIYKALECLELRFGGGETEFLKLEWATPSQIKLMKRTANTLRHAKKKFESPDKPMTLAEATALLSALLRRGLSEARSATETLSS